MTELDFYILNKPQTRIDFVAKLCLKVHGLGHKIFIYTESLEQSQVCSDALWAAKPSSFLANEIIDVNIEDNLEAISHKSPIKISHNICNDSAPLLDNDILINLSLEVPPIFSRFNRAVEVIDSDETVKKKLRNNYRFYQQRGYTLKTHQIN